MYSILVTLFLTNIALAIPSSDILDRNAVPFWGGYALAYSGANCPANTLQCVGNETPGSNSGNVNIHACCPVGSTCIIDDDATYCCPDTTDCIGRIQTETVCANTAWDLYNATAANGPFCCQAGETAISDPTAKYGECWVPGSPIVSSEIASSIPQVPVTFLPLSGSTSVAATDATETAKTSSTKTTETSTAPDKTSSAIAAASTDVSKVALSKNAIIGVAIGGFVFVALAVGICVCCCWRIRRSRRNRKFGGMN